MSYGLLASGPVRKPATQTKADIFSRIRQLPGYGEVRDDKGSLAVVVDAVVEELTLLWEAWEAAVLALNRDAASGQSLDAILAAVGKSRQLAQRSATSLTLWTVNTSGSVSVPAGNQAKQSATGVLWQTTEDATIPAAVHVVTDLDVNNITWQSGTTVRYTFSGSPSLANVAVNDLLIVTGAATVTNNGPFRVTAVNDGSDYIDVNNILRTSSTGDETGSAATARTTDGVTTALAESLNAGEFAASAQSINTINTPVSNWEGVANLAAATTGRAKETDAEFRRRAAAELVIAQGSTLEAVKAQLREVDGVTYVAGTENRTATTGGDGNLPHSQRFTVVGGTDQAIINAIGAYKAAGIATNGDQTGTYTDPEGGTHTLYFDRVTEINPYIRVLLTTTGDYPSDGNTLISDALTALEFDHGEDLYNYALIAAIANANIPGITGVTVYQGTSVSPSNGNTISISPTEVLIIIADRIAFS